MKQQKIIIFTLLFMVFVLCAYSYSYSNRLYEGYQIQRHALCLLTVNPHDIYVKFLNNFDKYDVYILIDNNSINIDEYIKKYPKIQFIQIPDEEAIQNGYWDSSYIIPKKTISWDKALYYFSKKNTSYNFVWFIEEDVYIPNEESIQNIDHKYPTIDLLCSDYNMNSDGYLDNWSHWNQAQSYFELPWAKGLQCICRLSKRLLEKIKDFVDTHKKLTFIETLFNTLVIKNNYLHITPHEFNEIGCCKTHNETEIDTTKFYHPIKNIETHQMLRDKLHLR